jgi:hypothetical protein
MKKSFFVLLCLIFVAKINAQNTNFNNVSIGTDGPAYGVKIKAYFPNYTGGWSRSFSVVNENDSNNYIVLGSFGGTTNGVSTLAYSFIGKDWDKTYLAFLPNGNVGIGGVNPRYKLDVEGTIRSREVIVNMEKWSDFVFKKDYNLPTLAEVEKHIKEKGHLENIPSEKEVLENGISLGEMNAKLLQKIEELTLYSIQQSKEIEVLKEENKSFKTLAERLSKIEQKIK